MKHKVEHVAKHNSLNVEKFVNFAKTSRNAWEENGVIVTTTLFVERLLEEFKNEEHTS
mgnify:CR=1 FL=1